MVRTRVGYAGGAKENPTYHSLGDHSETIQIDYDPTQISYQELLDIFWSNHDPTSPVWSRQYAAVIFYHNEEQRRQAEESRDRLATQLQRQIYTEIVPYSRFYLAEDYHQKYRLRQVRELLRDFQSIYPDEADFVNSTAVARVNGYVAGYGSYKEVETALDSLGLSQEGAEKLLDIVTRYQRW